MNYTIAIYGATSGLGWELAKEFYRVGWNICCFGRRAQRLMGLKSAFCYDSPKKCHLTVGDITKKDSIGSFIESSVSKYKTIDLNIICSALYSGSSNKDHESNWRQVMETNFWGTYNVIEKTKDVLKKGNKSVMIAITSSLAKQTIKGSGPYSTSKVAMECLLQSSKVDYSNTNFIFDVVEVPSFRSEMNFHSDVSAEHVAKNVSEQIIGKYF